LYKPRRRKAGQAGDIKYLELAGDRCKPNRPNFRDDRHIRNGFSGSRERLMWAWKSVQSV